MALQFLSVLSFHDSSHLFILNKYLLRICHVPGTILGARDTLVNRTETNSCLMELHFNGRREYDSIHPHKSDSGVCCRGKQSVADGEGSRRMEYFNL